MLHLLMQLFLLTSAHSAIVQKPAQCLVRQELPCAVRAYEKTEVFSFSGNVMRLAPGSSVLILSRASAQLLGGQVWVEASKDFRLLHGLVEIDFSGEVLVRRGELDRVYIDNLDARIEMRSWQNTYIQELPVGFGLWIAGLNSRQEIEQGVLSPFDKKSKLRDLNKLASEPPESLKKRLAKLALAWKGNLDQATNIYQEIVQRRIASIQEKEFKSRQLRLQKQLEQEKALRMFRQKYYFPDQTP